MMSRSVASMAARLACLAAPLLACGQTPAPASGPRVAVGVRALSLSGIGNARYTLTVTNALGQTVWSRQVDADTYGDGVGSLSYVGPCDASANPNTVTLTLDELRDTAGALVSEDTYVDPTPLARTIECLESRDAEVRFDLTIARDAQQGFFDVAVNLADVFCSAKLDCRDDGEELLLLHDPATGERDTTVVLAFACTAGPDQATALHMSDLVITCPGAGTYTLDPTAGPGLAGARPPLVFEHAVYRGVEGFTSATPPIAKAYWNVAIGLATPLPGHAGCRLTAEATVTEGVAPLGVTPSDTVYPFVRWDVALTGDTAGALACDRHPLGGEDGGVAIDYTDFGGKSFCHSLEITAGAATVHTHCGPTRTCAASGGAGGPLAVMPSGDGFVISAGGKARAYALPVAGATIDGCCAEACCLAP